eukprot:PhM_4_TR11044/c0_g2_i1/m.87632
MSSTTTSVPLPNSAPVDTHPVASTFHILFKVAAIIVYLVGNFVSGSYVGVFITCTLLIAADFWTVKNVTGRLLVGLRWWNQIAEDGASTWHFESLSDTARLNDREAYLFWSVTAGNCVVWGLFSVFSVFSFQWLPLAVLGFVLATSNFVGYFRCRRDAKQKITQVMASAITRNPGMMGAVVNATTGSNAV